MNALSKVLEASGKKKQGVRQLYNDGGMSPSQA